MSKLAVKQPSMPPSKNLQACSCRSSAGTVLAKSDMTKQKRMQKSFMNHVFGGKEYNGKGMKAAHKHLKLTDEHFNRVATHLSESLLFLGVESGLVDQVMAVVATTKNDVLGRDPKA
ncbi:hypothetical protein HDV03_003928 [Kappamyces sp. JEL0829]|nr:hypothetical protein HDV03_003928 [Kappamyces sp. JEL0829]